MRRLVPTCPSNLRSWNLLASHLRACGMRLQCAGRSHHLALSNGVSGVQTCSVFPNGCAEFGVNSVSAVKPCFVEPLLPPVLPGLAGLVSLKRRGKR